MKTGEMPRRKQQNNVSRGNTEQMGMILVNNNSGRAAFAANLAHALSGSCGEASRLEKRFPVWQTRISVRCFSFSFCSRCHRSAGKGSYARRPSLSILPKIALEAVPVFVWLNTSRSRPRRVECRPLPFSSLHSFGRSML